MLKAYVITHATLHLKSIVSRKVSVFGGIQMRNIISCYYFASFSFRQLIENSSPVKWNSHGISSPSLHLYLLACLWSLLYQSLSVASLRNFVSQFAINFGTCPMTSKSSLISFGCAHRLSIANSRCHISRWPDPRLFSPLLCKLSRTTATALVSSLLLGSRLRSYSF